MSSSIEPSIVPIVLVRSDGALDLIGTGIVISPGAVITCRHVIKRSRTVLCGAQLCQATRARVSPHWDLGCLYFDALPGTAPAPLFRSSSLSGTPLFAMGFQQDDHGIRIDRIPRLPVRLEQISGGGLKAVQIDGGVPRGLSGAPVVVKSRGNEFVVGMLWLGGEKSGSSRMIAVDTIAACLSQEPVPGFSIADLTSAADGCLRIPSRTWLAEKHGPAAMLIAEYEIVPFGGRTQELADIDSWASGPRGLGIRVYHERGGVGKTRLALQACRILSEKGFRAGFLDQAASVDEIRLLFAAVESAESRGLFVVIDYAETDAGGLLNMIAVSEEFPKVRLRLMLLARGIGDWWEAVTRAPEGVGDVLTGPATDTPIQLGPVVVSPESRAREFDRAAIAFAAKLDREIPNNTEVEFAAPIFERALLLHTCALFAVLGIAFRKTRTKNADPFLRTLWGREIRFIERIMRSRGMEVLLCRTAVMTLGAITAIRGVTDMADAVSVIRSMPSLSGTSDSEAIAVVQLLHDVYGGSNWIDPLQPDILGEYAFARVFENFPADAAAVLIR